MTKRGARWDALNRSEPDTPLRSASTRNPYLAAAHPYLAVDPFSQMLTRIQIGDDLYTVRTRLTQQYAWAIPDDAALDALAALGPIVEIGAGTGYWASLLAARGVDIVAYDARPYHNNWCDGTQHFPVQRGRVRPAADAPERTLLLCWPPMSSLAVRALQVYRGATVAYIGETAGGCTASDAFFDRLDQDWTERQHIQIPQWWGIYDALWIYDRRHTPAQ